MIRSLSVLGGFAFLAFGCSDSGRDAPAQPSAPDAGTMMEPIKADAAPPPPHDAAPTEPIDARMPDAATPDAGMPAAMPPAEMMTPDAAMPPTAAGETKCAPRMVTGMPGMHFHHVHFNTTDPALDLKFFQDFFSAPPVDFCKDDKSSQGTQATLTDRGYFLYTRVAKAPDPALNTYLEHTGWIHPDPAAELQRLVSLHVPLFPAGRAQCDSAAMGQAPCSDYWFYLQAPSGARIEVAKGPGPATMGFGHLHFIMGEDYSFYEKVSDGAFKNKVIDMVNHTDAALLESILSSEMVTETRGKPIDHVGWSTTTLEMDRDRIQGLGIKIEEDISFKPEYGFRSFFVKSPKGIWLEIVEDTPFMSGG